MLKLLDQDTKTVKKSLLRSKKVKPSAPIKFATPPKDILPAIVTANELKKRQGLVIKDLKKSLSNPECSNPNSLKLQLELMEKSHSKLGATIRRIVTHLAYHKFNGINVVRRYHLPGQPDRKNWCCVLIEGNEFYLSLSQKNFDLTIYPYLGEFTSNSNIQIKNETSMLTDEAVAVCDKYDLLLKTLSAEAKDLNNRITTHNKVVKILKSRIQKGLTEIITDQPTYKSKPHFDKFDNTYIKQSHRKKESV